MKRTVIAVGLLAAATATVAEEKPSAQPSPAAPSTPAIVTLSVTTRTTGGQYAPKHVLAAWVTTPDGRFVKTLAVYGGKFRKLLSEWNARSKADVVDAVTGATRLKHAPLTFTWDGRDSAGKSVPDGDYLIRLEFTENNRSGPVTPPTHIRVTKGPGAAAFNPTDLDNFTAISVTYPQGQ